MCMTVNEMNEAMKAIKEWEMVIKEAEDNIAPLKTKVIEYLTETEECEAVDKKGNPIRKFIGSIFKATLSKGERETVDKAEVKKLLNEEDYKKVSKVSTYPVLRIS